MKQFHQEQDTVLQSELGTSLKDGLTGEEAKRRLEKYGPNELKEEKKVSPVQRFFLQFKNFLVFLLIAAAVISFIFEDYIEGVIILTIIFLNAVLGFVQEYKAEQSLEKLKQLAGDDTLVIRDGNELRVDIRDLVIGDVLLLWEGETIGADARIVEASRLKVEEGILTGESVSVNKHAEPIPEEKVALADQKNMAFAGTTTVNGKGKAIIVKTGMDTEMGKIAKATIEAKEEKTPLQEQLDKLGKFLGIIVIAIVVTVFLAELLVHSQGTIPTQEEFVELLETAIALAVSAVPEGMTAAITLTLAIGVQRMAKKRAIIRRLPAVETLGSCQVICTDKTGTLTLNRMTVQRLWTPGDGLIEITGAGYLPKGNFIQEGASDKLDIDKEQDVINVLKAGYLASTAVIQYSSKANDWICEGDPTEGALVVAAMKTSSKLDWEEVYEPVKNGEIFFDSVRKRMSIVYKHLPSGETWAFEKGSPESVLDTCTKFLVDEKLVPMDEKMRKTILETNMALANKAYRVLAVAERKIDESLKEYTDANTEKNMVFLGLEAMMDPPREEVATAINKAKKAGIRILMITGDQRDTALAIAKALDLKPFEDAVYTCHTAAELEAMDDARFKDVLKDLDVCARASPSIKARIVDTLQEEFGLVVAMTGDGVNDAPALKSADIGIAMGITGTDVSKEAADMVLSDDNFATIVSAIEEGRQIFDNMKSFIRFMLSSNFDEILVVFFATVLLGLPSPFLALGILWINLLTDGLPALALSVDPGDHDIMSRKPRDKKSSLLKEILAFALIAGVIAFVATLWLFMLYQPTDLPKARTVALTVSVLFELAVVFVTRTPDNKSVFRTNPVNNKFLLVAVGLAFGLHLLTIYFPPMAAVFQFTPIGGEEWGLMLLAVGIGVVLLDVTKIALHHVKRLQ